MSPKNNPSTGTPIHKNTHKIRGETEVLASSLLNIPGKTISKKMISPKNLPKFVCLVEVGLSVVTKIDSFQETFKNTKVRTITNPETLRTVSKGIGKSPTLPIPW